MESVVGNADPIKYLSYGAMGVGFFLAILAFYLLWTEQRRPNERSSILRATLLLMILSLVLTGMGFWNDWDKRHAEQVNIRVVAKVEGTDPADPIQLEVCAGPWSLDVEGQDVNQEVHANLNDFRIRIVAPGYLGSTNIPISRIKVSDQKSGPIYVDNDGIARLGTYALHKELSPPPAKDFTRTSGVRP
jgi:hypothetical protein